MTGSRITGSRVTVGARSRPIATASSTAAAAAAGRYQRRTVTRGRANRTAAMTSARQSSQSARCDSIAARSASGSVPSTNAASTPALGWSRSVCSALMVALGIEVACVITHMERMRVPGLRAHGFGSSTPRRASAART